MRVVSARAGRWVLATLVAAGTIAAIEVLVAEGDEFADRRNAMVDALVANGIISDARVIGAMRMVPRHLFVSEAQRDLAYRDQALPIAHGQNLYAPSIIGIMVEALAPEASARVLEIGAGCGYQTAVLAKLVRHVYSVEPNAELAVSAQARLRELGITNATVKQGDPSAGWPEQAPFDAIVVNAAAEDVPPALLDQLAEGGRMVIALIEEGWAQKLYLITKQGGQLARTELADVIFAPMARGEEAGVRLWCFPFESSRVRRSASSPTHRWPMKSGRLPDLWVSSTIAPHPWAE